MRAHVWWVKHKILPLFDEGKDLEIRVHAPYFESICAGTVITLNKQISRRVKAIRIYNSFYDMLIAEDEARILPGSTPGQILKILKEVYPPEKEKSGVYVFELEAA